MTEGFAQTLPPLAGDGSHLISTGPYTIQADSAVRVAFAIIGATNEQDLLNSAEEAKNNYNAGTVTLSPSVMLYNAPVGGPEPSPQTLAIHNGTDLPLTFEVTETPVFAEVEPTSGEIPAGDQSQLTVTVTVGDRPAGLYRDTLVITTSDALLPVAKVQVNLTVGGSGDFSVNPNPFDPAAAEVVVLSLSGSATPGTSARVYDLAGEFVTDLGEISAGATSVLWDGKSDDDHLVASGVYIGRVEAPGDGGFSQSFKIVVKKK
jgi:hypothetical protein